MIRAFLFDLDYTLLPYSCPQNEMLEVLLGSLAGYFSEWVHPDRFIPAIMKGIEAMDRNRSGSISNLELLSSAFTSLVDVPRERLEQSLVDYWRTEANSLERLTRPSSYPRRIMDWLFKHDVEVVIATGFQAPLNAAELRLKWAGIPVTDYDYRFIATWDNMHASKPHHEYYQEVVSHIDRNAEDCLFVGDDWDSEIIPTSSLGIPSYWVVDLGTELPERLELLSGYGQLPQLYEWITSLNL